MSRFQVHMRQPMYAAECNSQYYDGYCVICTKHGKIASTTTPDIRLALSACREAQKSKNAESACVYEVRPVVDSVVVAEPTASVIVWLPLASGDVVRTVLAKEYFEQQFARVQ